MTHITQYFGKSFEAKDIQVGNVLPIGGDHIHSDSVDLETIIDSGLEPIINEMKVQEQSHNKEGLTNWLKQSNIEVDAQLYSALFAFTIIYQDRIGHDIVPESERKPLYNDTKPLLSDMITGKKAACAEISALAQLYLQELGIESSYFSGEVVWDKNHEFGSAHSYIHIIHEDKEYIFDPTNPLKQEDNGNTKFIPRIYSVQDFKEKISRNMKTLVEARSIYNNSIAYYGTGDGTNLTDNAFM